MGNAPAAKGEVGCGSGDCEMEGEAEPVEIFEDVNEVLRSSGDVPLSSARRNVDCAER